MKRLHRAVCLLAALTVLVPPGAVSAAVTAADGSGHDYDPSGAVRFGPSAAFRPMLPPDVVEQQARNAYRQLIDGAAKNKVLDANDAQVKRVRAIVARLIPYAFKWNERAKTWQWEINVVRGNRIDALCTAGGKMVFYTGMLDRLHLTDDEIALLAGHEIAHALREQARAQLGRERAVRLGDHRLSLLYGLADPASTQLGDAKHPLRVRYDRADETEADVIGSDIAAHAGFDPRAALTLWRKLADENRRTPLDFIAMHPVDKMRLGDIRKRLPDLVPVYAKAARKKERPAD